MVINQFRYFIDWVNSRINNFTLNSDLCKRVKICSTCRGFIYPAPKKAARQKCLNVENRKDNECLKLAPRAALLTVPNGKTSSCPVNDGIDYAGISFPTPLHDIDKLEAQNEK